MATPHDFLADLQVPIRSFRLFALEQAIEAPPDPKVWNALQAMQATESDPECQILLSHALRRHDPAAQGGPDDRVFDPERLKVEFPTLDPAGKIRCLRSIPSARRIELASWAPDAFERETDPLAASFIVREFGEIWPQDRFQILGKAMLRGYYSVRYTALSILVNRAPQALVRDLPKLLTADDQRIRFLAVKGLMQIDPVEAVAHLEALLMGDDPAMKRVILQGCSMLPFDLVKTVLLKFIAVETDSALIDAAGVPFQMNPDIETPFSLMEIMESSLGKKAQLLQAILQGAIQVLKDSDLLGDRFSSYNQQMQEAIERRKAGKYVREILNLIESGDPDLLEEAEASLRRRQESPLIRATLEKARRWPLNPSVKEYLERFLQGQPLVATEQSIPTDFSENLPVEAQCRWLANLQESDLATARPILEAVLGRESTPCEVRYAALRSAARLRMKGFSPYAWECLKGADEHAAIAGFEYLNRIEPDEILPWLGRLFKSAQPRLQAAVMKAFHRHDPVQALSTLILLLKQAAEKGESISFTCLVHFDFFVIREPLVEVLSKNTAGELLSQALCLFQANPDKENLYLLYVLEQQVPPPARKLVTETRNEVEKSLIEIGLASRQSCAEWTAGFPARWLADKARREAPPPPYSVKRLEKKAEPTVGEAWREFLTERFSTPSIRRIILGLLIGTAIMQVLFILQAGGKSETPQQASSGPILNQGPLTATGEITEWRGSNVLLKSSEGPVLQLSPLSGEFPAFPLGHRLKVTYLPMRVFADGTIFGTCIGFE